MSGLLAALAEGRVESVTSELRRLTDAAGGVHSRAVGVQGPGLASAPSELCDSCVPHHPDLSFLSVQTLSRVARTQEANTRQRSRWGPCEVHTGAGVPLPPTGKRV